MRKRVLLLILPLTVAAIFGVTLYTSLSEFWSWPVPVYFAILGIVAIYTARQSVFIQSSLILEIEELDRQEQEDLAVSIAGDFILFFLIHGLIVSALYALVYWAVVWTIGT